MEQQLAKADAQGKLLESQVQLLRDSLTAERDAAQASIAMARSELEVKLAEEVAKLGNASQVRVMLCKPSPQMLGRSLRSSL